MRNKALTLTIISNMTANYNANVNGIKRIQKVYKEGKGYAIRTKESIKQSIMIEAGFNINLNTDKDGKVVYKKVDEKDNVKTNRALEAGYMNLSKLPLIRKSSFYLTDAISFTPFKNGLKFHNNLRLADIQSTKDNKSISESGFMPYQYEFDNSMKKYSITIDLDRIGVDENFKVECDIDEKIYRVHKLLDAVNNLSLVVSGNLDNAEPIFIVGGIGKYKTHYFDNVVMLNEKELLIPDKFMIKLNEGYRVGFDRLNTLSNEDKIIEKLNPLSISKFFEQLKLEVKDYYESFKN